METSDKKKITSVSAALRESTDWGLSRCEGEPGFTGSHTVGQEGPLVSLRALMVPGERSARIQLTLGSIVSSSPSGSSADFSHFCPKVVERRRTPAEIREEFERLQREREERRLQQRTNPKVSGWFWGEQRSDVVSAVGSYSEAVRIGRNRVSLIRSQSGTCLEGH